MLGLVALNNMIVAYWAPNNLSWYAATIATTGQWSDTCGVFGYQCGTHGTMTFIGLDRNEQRRLDVDVRHARLQLRPESALAPATLVPDGRQALHRSDPAGDHASLVSGRRSPTSAKAQEPGAPIGETMDLDALLVRISELGASDLHLKLGQPPIVRRDGTIAGARRASRL